MKANLSKLVDGCVDAHVNSALTKDARSHFRALIQHAYDLGVRDAQEDARQEDLKRRQEAASQGTSQKLQGNGIEKTSREASQGSPGILTTDEERAKKAIASL